MVAIEVGEAVGFWTGVLELDFLIGKLDFLILRLMEREVGVG